MAKEIEGYSEGEGLINMLRSGVESLFFTSQKDIVPMLATKSRLIYIISFASRDVLFSESPLPSTNCTLSSSLLWFLDSTLPFKNLCTNLNHHHPMILSKTMLKTDHAKLPSSHFYT